MEEQIIEPLSTGDQLSGPEVLEDLACQIVEELSKDCNLRATDSFAAYSAKISVRLFLFDIDVQEVAKDITIGHSDSQPPTHEVTIELPRISAEEAREHSGLSALSMEGGSDGSPVPDMPAKRKVRFYAPRRRTTK